MEIWCPVRTRCLVGHGELRVRGRCWHRHKRMAMLNFWKYRACCICFKSSELWIKSPISKTLRSEALLQMAFLALWQVESGSLFWYSPATVIVARSTDPVEASYQQMHASGSFEVRSMDRKEHHSWCRVTAGVWRLRKRRNLPMVE